MKLSHVWESPPARLIDLFRRTQSQAENRGREEVQQPGDTVEISDEARFKAQMQSLPAVRHDRVEQVRSELRAGTYDVDSKLDAALDRLCDEMPLEEMADRITRPRRL